MPPRENPSLGPDRGMAEPLCTLQRVLLASLTPMHHSPHALCPAGPCSAPPARACTCAQLEPSRVPCTRFRSALATSGASGGDFWRYLYVRDGAVSTAPRSSCVAAVCRSELGSGVVSGRMAGVWPMVSKDCVIFQSSFDTLTRPDISTHRRAAAEIVQKSSGEDV